MTIRGLNFNCDLSSEDRQVLTVSTNPLHQNRDVHTASHPENGDLCCLCVIRRTQKSRDQQEESIPSIPSIPSLESSMLDPNNKPYVQQHPGGLSPLAVPALFCKSSQKNWYSNEKLRGCFISRQVTLDAF